MTDNPLLHFLHRVINLDTEIADLRADRKQVLAEAKAQGFDAKALAAVAKLRNGGSKTELDAENVRLEAYYAATQGAHALAELPAPKPGEESIEQIMRDM